MKNVDTQAFWNSVTSGMTAQAYVERGLEIVRQNTASNKQKNAFVTAERFHQGPSCKMYQPPSPTADKK